MSASEILLEAAKWIHHMCWLSGAISKTDDTFVYRLVVFRVNNGLFCVFCGSLIFSGVNLGASSQFSDFLDGLGPAQLVGRQTLATPAIGTKPLLSSFELFGVFFKALFVHAWIDVVKVFFAFNNESENARKCQKSLVL